MDAEIRSARESDGEAIVALIRLWRVEDNGRATGDSGVERVVQLCTNSPERDMLVGTTGGAITGYVVVHWIPFPMMGGTEGYISDLIVSPAGRGTGLGSRLISTVEALARDKGCERLMLNNRVATDSFKRGFYSKRGFRHRVEFANMVKILV